MSQQTTFKHRGGQVQVKCRGTARVEDSVGMIDVSFGKVLDRVLEGRKSNDDLFICLSKGTTIRRTRGDNANDFDKLISERMNHFNSTLLIKHDLSQMIMADSDMTTFLHGG